MGKSFFSYTSMAGFHNLTGPTAKPAAIRALWMTILLLCFLGFGYQFYWLIANFWNEPTATILTTTYPDTFPSFVYCPRFWVDMKKAEAHGLDTQSFAYLESILAEMQVENLPEMTETEIETGAHKLQTAIDTYANGSIDELLHQISYETSQLFKAQKYHSYIAYEKFISLLGACYRIRSSKIYTKLEMTRAYYMLMFKRMEPAFYHHGMAIDHFGMGALMDSIMPVSESHIHHEMHYFMKVKYEYRRHLNLRRAPCNDTVRDYNTRNDCLYNCVNVLCAEAGLDNTLYLPGHGMGTVAGLTSVYRHVEAGQSCFMKMESKFETLCTEKCIPPCVHEGYHIVETPFPDDHNGSEFATSAYVVC